jgi:dienelactone hydrolase
MRIKRLTRMATGLALAALMLGCRGNEAAPGWKDFAIQDFAKVHSEVAGDANRGLILGAIPISSPARDLPSELAAFLGRWEGFDLSPPVKKDIKGVLVVSEINPRGGKAFLYACNNLQFPFWVKEIEFEVVRGTTPSIRWRAELNGGPNGISGTASYSFAYDRASGALKGGIDLPEGSTLSGPFELTREKTFFVYKDYARYFESERFYPKKYRRSFPEAYLDGVMAEIGSDYRIDPKRRYLTGLSMGGEASYRYALHRPEAFAAVAPLAAFDARFNPAAARDGFLPIAGPLDRVKDLPIRAFHGEDDMVVPLSAAKATAEEFSKAGALVELKILEGHDHDVWTDTYLDPGFYEWLLSHHH